MSPGQVTNRTTIRDVARAAGVSTTTVSDALNGRGRLPVETRERVSAVAETLGYRPRGAARNLRSGRTGQLGLYCPFLGDIRGGLAGTGYYMELAMGAAEVALAEDLALVLLPAGLTADRLAAVDVDGLIVADPLRDDFGIQMVAARGTTIVTCERDPSPGADHPGCVRSDHTRAMQELLAHVEQAGARRIALIAAGAETAWSGELGEAYRRWCAQHGAPVLEARVPIAPKVEFAERAALSLLDDAPDAIVVAPDGGAVSVARALEAHGSSALVASCVDGPAVASAGITAIDLQPAEVGRRAAATLAGLLAGRLSHGVEAEVPTRLIVRASTAGGA